MTVWLRLLTSNIWEFVKPFLVILLSNSGQILAQAAMNAVTNVALAYGNSSGEQKRQLALDSVGKELQRQGIEMGASVINMALEAAVQKLKSADK